MRRQGTSSIWLNFMPLTFDDPWSAELLLHWLGHPVGFCVTARDQLHDVVGFGLAILPADQAELLTLAVHPDFRRRGVATAIIRELNSHAVGRGAESWVLDVAEDNQSARRLYLSLGFTELARRRGYYKTSEGTVDALVLSVPTNRFSG